MIQRSRLLAIAALAVVSLWGCGGSKDLVSSTPEWVLELPMDPSAYLGIASAPKASFPGRAMEVAKERALGDLARTIGVKVETSSSINTLQQNEWVQSSFREQSKSSSAEDLEGYELVATFESETEAWAYYRLNRLKWSRIVSDRKAAATQVALGFFESAQAAEEAGDVIAAVDRYLRGMEALNKYWGELNEGQTQDGRTLSVDRACLDGITRIVGSLRLEPSETSLAVDFTTGFKSTLTVQAFSQRGAVANLPLKFQYQRGTWPRVGDAVTNADGLADIAIHGLEPQLNQSEVVVNISFADALMAGDAEHLPGARTLLEGLPLPELRIPIAIERPLVFIEARESLFGSPVGENRLGIADAVAEVLHEQHMGVTQTEAEADLIIEIVADTEKAGSGNGFHTAYLNARVHVLDARTGDLVLQKNLDRVKGVQLDWDGAGRAAYDKASREIKGRFISDLIASLYR